MKAGYSVGCARYLSLAFWPSRQARNAAAASTSCSCTALNLSHSRVRLPEQYSPVAYHTFLMRSLRSGELPHAKLGDVLAVAQQRIARQKSFQNLLSFKQRFFVDILAAHE